VPEDEFTDALGDVKGGVIPGHLDEPEERASMRQGAISGGSRLRV
jgi:hypothetical protein